VVMLPEAFALVCWRSIWTESGEPLSKLPHRSASKKSIYLTAW